MRSVRLSAAAHSRVENIDLDYCDALARGGVRIPLCLLVNTDRFCPDSPSRTPRTRGSAQVSKPEAIPQSLQATRPSKSRTRRNPRIRGFLQRSIRHCAPQHIPWPYLYSIINHLVFRATCSRTALTNSRFTAGTNIPFRASRALSLAKHPGIRQAK
jgi:hypothetical protein